MRATDTATIGMREAAGAWMLCLLPRAAIVLAAWPEGTRLDTPSTLITDSGALATSLAGPFWPPLYGMAASVLWALSAHTPAVFLALQVALHALVGPLVLAQCTWLGLSTRVGWISVAAVTWLPYYVSTAARQLDVGFTIVMAASVVAAYAAWSRRRDTCAGVVFAALAAVLMLDRANAFTLVGGLFVLHAAAAPPAQRWKSVRVPVTIFVALLLAWSGLQKIRFGHFTPLPANGGYSLYVGNNPESLAYLSRREIVYTTAAFADVSPAGPDTDAYAADAGLAKRAWSFMASNPMVTVRAAVVKFARYWDFDLDGTPPYATTRIVDRLLYSLPYALYLPLAIGGAALLRRRRQWRALGVLAVTIAAYLLPHLVVFGQIRMRMTVEFALLILAAVTVDWVFSLRQRSPR